MTLADVEEEEGGRSKRRQKRNYFETGASFISLLFPHANTHKLCILSRTRMGEGEGDSRLLRKEEEEEEEESLLFVFGRSICGKRRRRKWRRRRRTHKSNSAPRWPRYGRGGGRGGDCIPLHRPPSPLFAKKEKKRRREWKQEKSALLGLNARNLPQYLLRPTPLSKYTKYKSVLSSFETSPAFPPTSVYVRENSCFRVGVGSSNRLMGAT